jgi:hypothetical protein
MAQQKNPTQAATVLRHIKRGWITPMQAFEQYGITRLAARVFELREEGHIVKTKSVKVPTRTGRDAVVTAYKLDKPQLLAPNTISALAGI